MPYDFHILKTYECADAVTLRVPARWNCGPHETAEGMWGCYENDEETGTLWINVDYFMRKEPTEPMGDFDLMASARDIKESMERDWPDMVESRLQREGDAVLWFRVVDSIDDDEEPIRRYVYHYFLEHRGNVCFIVFSLVLPNSILDDPEIQRLVEIVDREVRAARLEPFKREERQEAEQTFGTLQRWNFEDKFLMVLPKSLGVSTYGGEEAKENEWYGSFDRDGLHAGIFFYLTHLNIVDEEDGTEVPTSDPRLLEPLWNVIDERIEEFESERHLHDDTTRVFRVPNGALTYYIEDGTTPEDQDNWMRNHIWKHVHVSERRP